MGVGIHAFGGYVPIQRLQRKAIAEANSWFNPGLRSLGQGERSICNWDEDAITMSDVDEATTKQLKEPSIKALVVVGDNGGRIVVCDGHLSTPSFLPPFDSRSLHVHAVTRGSEKDVAQVGAVVAAVGSCRDGSFLLRTFAVSDDGAFAGGVAELPLSRDAPASLALRSDGRLCAIGFGGACGPLWWRTAKSSSRDGIWS